MLSKEEQFVHNLYNESAKNDKNSRGYAALISSVINDTLSGEKYINELIQNADDQESRSVQFILTDDYLIYKHQGKHFTESDVESIATCASSENKKRLNSQKIGHKGIGFKAVFSMASTVTIISNKFCFSFDENHPEWQGKSEHFPWPIIPIPSKRDAFPEAVKTHFDDASVHFVFRVRKNIRPEIETHLQKLTSSKLLFLRFTKEIIISKGSEVVRQMKLEPPKALLTKDADSLNLNEIKITDNQSWLLNQVECSLPNDLQAMLARANNIPEKFKAFKTLPITIAFRRKDEQLYNVASDVRVFCYLPTELDFGLKYTVNAEFLLDSSRMQLRSDDIGNAWNGFILENIYRESVKFLSVLSIRTRQWSSVLEILSPPSLLPPQFERFKDRCTIAFNNAKKNFSLIMNLKKSHLYPIESAMIDMYGFIEKFGTSEYQQKCAHPQVSNQALMKVLGATTLSTKNILECIAQSSFLDNIKDPEKNNEFLDCMRTLYFKSNTSEQAAIKAAFQKNTFILSDRNQLEIPSEIFFRDERLNHMHGGFSFLKIVHPMIEKTELKQWLTLMGVGNLSLAQIIAKANLAKEELIKFTLHLATMGTLVNDPNSKRPEIESLKVVNIAGEVVSAAACYLSDSFDPELKITRFLREDSPFILKDYTPSASELVNCKALLSRMGVHQSIDLRNLAIVVKAVNESNEPGKIIRFTQWVFTKYYLNKSTEEQNKVILLLKSLSVVSVTNETKGARFLYLPKKYKPVESVEDIFANNSGQISVDYIEDESHIQAWHDFFIALGVKEKISLEVMTKTYLYLREGEYLQDKDPSAKQYLQYISDIKVKDRKCLYPSATSSYKSQHYLDGCYVKIEFIQELFSTPYFWRLLSTHWYQFGPQIVSVSYETARSSESVPSNIHYWVLLAVQERYGKDKVPADFYGHGIKDHLGEYTSQCSVSIAEITAGLTHEQSAILGFRSHLSLSDCLAVLAQIAKAGRCLDDMNKIIFVYQQLLHHISDLNVIDAASKKSILLPNQHGTFLPANQLVYVADDLFPDSDNDCLIKKPDAISSEDFQSLCQLMGITIAHFNDCTVKPDKLLESTLISSFNEKLYYILCMEAYSRDLVGVNNVQSRASLRATIQDKLSKINPVAANNIQVMYADKLDESLELWIVPNKQTIYHYPHETLGHKEERALYEFIHRYLELRCTFDDFLYIMTSPIEKSCNKFRKRFQGFDEASFSGAAQPALKQANVATAENVLAVVTEDGPSNQASSSGQKRTHNTDEEEKADNKKRIQLNGQSSGPQRFFFSERFTRVQRYEIGYRGEEAVYHFLKDKHTKKYSAANITESLDGYTINRGYDGVKSVRWLNKRPADLPIDESNSRTYESFKPYDFEVSYCNHNVYRTRQLEVKTTTATDSPLEVSCSKAEWEQVTKNGGKDHRLFVVRATVKDGVVSVNPNCIWKKNIIKEQAEGRAEITDYMRIKLK